MAAERSDAHGICHHDREKLRKLREIKLTLPPLLEGWLLLRRPRAAKEQRSLVLSTVGLELTLDKVKQYMFFVLGQDSVPERGFRGRTADVHYGDDDEYDDDAYGHGGYGEQGDQGLDYEPDDDYYYEEPDAGYDQQGLDDGTEDGFNIEEFDD